MVKLLEFTDLIMTIVLTCSFIILLLEVTVLFQDLLVESSLKEDEL